jgi:hypothetical protein
MTIFEKIGLSMLRRRVFEMKGWKTWTGAIAIILTGLATAIQGFNESDWNKVAGGITLIGSGIAAIGIGAKLDKNTTAITDQTQTIKEEGQK